MTHPAAPAPAPRAVIPMAAPIGAELTGLDVAAGLDDAAIAFVRDALHHHAVIVIRGQQLTPAQQTIFAKQIGEPRVSFYNRYAVPGQPELSIVSNITENGESIGIADAGMLWHTDGSYLKTPDLYTVLYGITIPERDGQPLGDTVFASASHAYEALPEAERARIDPLRAIHSFERHIEKKRAKGQLKRAPLSAEQKAALPDVDHPVVRTHPVTGRRGLFVTEGHTAEIVGLEPEEGRALLDRLNAQVQQPEFQYRHAWRPGDLIVWDNCAVQHLAVFDYGAIPRRLHRSGILGPVPV